MKKLTNLKGVKLISRSDQKVIHGGQIFLIAFGDGSGDPSCGSPCESNGDCLGGCDTCVTIGGSVTNFPNPHEPHFPHGNGICDAA